MLIFLNCHFCCSAGVWPAIVYTHTDTEGKPEYGIYFKIFEVTQYSMNTLYYRIPNKCKISESVHFWLIVGEIILLHKQIAKFAVNTVSSGRSCCIVSVETKLWRQLNSPTDIVACNNTHLVVIVKVILCVKTNLVPIIPRQKCYYALMVWNWLIQSNSSASNS